jgi:hypothetical protein
MNMANEATKTTETANVETTETKTTQSTNAEPTGTGAGAKTEEERWAEREKQLREEMQKETERRVTDAVKTANAKWKKDAEREKLSEEERRKLEDQERAQENARKEHELIMRGLRLDVVDAISELGMDAGFRNLVAVDDLALISDEAERKQKLTDRIKGMKKLFDDEVKKQVEKEKAEFLKGHTPPASKEKQPEADSYAEAKKAGNVKGMLSAKLEAYRNGEE